MPIVGSIFWNYKPQIRWLGLFSSYKHIFYEFFNEAESLCQIPPSKTKQFYLFWHFAQNTWTHPCLVNNNNISRDEIKT